MTITIHRGTHQVGGVATEIRTAATRLIVDMGEELSLDPDYKPQPLCIDGVTNSKGTVDAVFLTHYHGDHMGQLVNLKDGVPLYMGALTKDILLAQKSSDEQKKCINEKVRGAFTFEDGKSFVIGDITVTPYYVDHTALDSHMFLFEADGKRVLLTGDFRGHGFRAKALPKLLSAIGKVDLLITEGTVLSRPDYKPASERELQQKMTEYVADYKYVFVLCATTNLDRIFGFAKTVPRGKYLIVDNYQKSLIDIVQKHLSDKCDLYKNAKALTYGANLLPKLKEQGFLMFVRDNDDFRKIIAQFDRSESIMLYSLWDGYRTKPGSTIPAFLELAGKWEKLHTSGHASPSDIKMLIDKTQPDTIIPMHTNTPDALGTLCSDKNVVVLQDGEEFRV